MKHHSEPHQSPNRIPEEEARLDSAHGSQTFISCTILGFTDELKKSQDGIGETRTQLFPQLFLILY